MCEEVCLNQSSSCEDIIAAISLPIVVKEEECSVSTSHYVDHKRHKHEEVFNKMRDEIDLLNEYVDKEAGQIIEVAKEECKLIQHDIHKNSFDEIKSVEDWLLVSKTQDKLKSYFSKITNELSTDLKSLEKSRSEDITKILSKYKNELVTIRFTSVKDIEKSFEEEIRNLNLNILKAFKRYEDVNVQLQVEGQAILDDCQKNAKEKSKAVAEKKAQQLWKKIQEKQSMKLLNEAIYNLSQEKIWIKEEFSEVAITLAKGISDFAEALQLPIEYDIKGEFWEQWIETLNSRLSSLDRLCKNVEQLLKSAVSALIDNFDDQVNKFSLTMGKKINSHFIQSYEHLNEFENDLEIPNEIEEFRTFQAKEMNQLQEKCQATVNLLNTKIERSKNFVLDLTAIWTTHLARVSKIHNHIDSTLASSYNTSLKKYKEKDAKLKGLVKSAREAKDVSTLNAMCETLKDKFQEQVVYLEDSYETQLEMMEEMKRKGVEELIKQKQLHINDFLNNKYRKKEWFFDESKPESIQLLEPSDSDFKIISQIDICDTYMTAVENRILGMYEMLERYAPHCETSVKEETEDWMNMFIQDIVNNYDSQVNEVNERQISTLQYIKQIRFAEIHIHSRRLISHTNGVRHEFSELNKCYDNAKAKQTQLLQVFNETVKSRLSNVDRKGVRNTMMELEQEWNCLLGALTNSISAGKILCEKKYADVKEASSLFLKTAKNFKNGGNYSSEELKALNKELNLLGKFALSQNKSILKNYDNLAKLISKNPLDSRIYQINKEIDVLRVHQNIVDTLSILRIRLRSEINVMKSKTKSIEEKISYVASCQRIDPDLLNEILTLIRHTNGYMELPEGILSLECTKVEESVVLRTPSTITKPQQRNKSVILKKTVDPLFKHTSDEVLSDKNNFLNLTKGLILKKYYYLIQAIEKMNLTTNSEVVQAKPSDSKQKGVKQNFESEVSTQQITLLKHVLRSYNSECELAWLSQTREFLDHVATLRKIFNAAAELELNKNHETYMQSLDGLEVEYLRLVNEKEPLKKVERERVQRMLVLPLAHPANHTHLSELRDKAKNLAQLQKDEYKTNLMKYKNDLQKKHDNNVAIVKMLKDRLSDLHAALFNEDLCKTLIDSSKGIKDVIPYEDTIVEATINTILVQGKEWPSSIWSDELDPGHDSQTSRSICVILLPTSSSASYESLPGGSGEATRMPINRIAAEQVKESAEKVQNFYDQARDSSEMNELTVQKWLELFEQTVNEAKLFHSWPCDS